jgi:hypothetical protein
LLQETHGTASQKTLFFIVNAVKTSNLTLKSSDDKASPKIFTKNKDKRKKERRKEKERPRKGRTTMKTLI